jgi:hypothetical protein
MLEALSSITQSFLFNNEEGRGEETLTGRGQASPPLFFEEKALRNRRESF